MSLPDEEKQADPASSVPRGSSNANKMNFDISGNPMLGFECEGPELG